MISAAMPIPIEAPSPASTVAGAATIAAAGAGAGAGRFTSGCVCPIFTVAFGSAGFAPASGGSVIRAVSFLGAAAFWVTGAGAGVGPPPRGEPGPGGAGFSGTAGRTALPGSGGFGAGVNPPAGGLARLGGAGVTPPSGFGGIGMEGFGGAGMPGADGAEGALGAEGAAGGKGAAAPLGSFVVSFFGAAPGGGTGRPGRLMRTVSRLIACCSCFGGSVIRIVSALEASSASEGAGLFSSDIKGETALNESYHIRDSLCQYSQGIP